MCFKMFYGGLAHGPIDIIAFRAKVVLEWPKDDKKKEKMTEISKERYRDTR